MKSTILASNLIAIAENLYKADVIAHNTLVLELISVKQTKCIVHITTATQNYGRVSN